MKWSLLELMNNQPCQREFEELALDISNKETGISFDLPEIIVPQHVTILYAT